MTFVRPTRLAVVAVLTAGLVLGVTAESADACRCLQRSFANARKQAAVIFIGEIVEVQLAPRERGESDRFTFEVSRVYQGEAPQRVVVSSNVTSCGWKTGGMRVGHRYLVYSRPTPDGGLTSRQCDRTARAGSKQARRDLARLGEGSPPSK